MKILILHQNKRENEEIPNFFNSSLYYLISLGLKIYLL